MAKIVRSRSPIPHLAPNAQILPAIGIKVISPGKNDGISISAPPPPPPRTKMHGSNNEKIIPTTSMSSIRPPTRILSGTSNIDNSNRHYQNAIVALEKSYNVEGNEILAKRKRFKNSFSFRLFKCIRLRKLDKIIKDVKANKLVYVDLFYYNLTEKNVNKVADALVQNFESSNSILQDIDIDWESLNDKTIKVLRNTKLQIIATSYEKSKVYVIESKFKQIIAKYKKISATATPFILACEEGVMNDVQQLVISYEILPNAYNFKYTVKEMINIVGKDSRHLNKTALQIAAEYNHADVVQYLISLGADVCAQDTKGFNALHFACLWDENVTMNQNAIELLLQKMSLDDINKKADDGSTPLDEAHKLNKIFYNADNKIIKLIRKYGGKANDHDIYGEFAGKGKGDLNVNQRDTGVKTITGRARKYSMDETDDCTSPH